MTSGKFTKLLKKTPLEIRVRVSVHMNLIDALTLFGLRGDKYWSDDDLNDVELSKKLSVITQSITDDIMRNYLEWEADGRPKRSSTKSSLLVMWRNIRRKLRLWREVQPYSYKP